MEFTELNLHGDLQKGIAEAGYLTCTPVQEQVLKNAFNGQDLYVQSQTGTGKTAAFLIVIYQRLLTESLLHGKKALIMSPTRELAVQIEEEAKRLAKYLPFKTGSFYGGVGYGQQQQLLRDNVQILVGTPGRVLDLNDSGQMNLMDIAFLVIDEADRMFDMGFYPDLRKLIKVVPPADRRQTMLFSATLNAWVKNLAWEYTKAPYEIEIAPETVTVEEVEQLLYHVSSEDKMKLLLGIMEREKPESAIIFCNTKRYTEIVAKRLGINGYKAEYIIGDLPQSRRLKIIEDVKAGKTRYLVATDVAARGLDIESLALVVNYDLPNEAENYVHRIGRTARAGKTGKAFTFASEQDVYDLAGIERYIEMKIPSEIAGDFLFAEDKSAEKHIRSGSYSDDRDRERGGYRNDRSARRYADGERGGDRRFGRKKFEKDFSPASDRKSHKKSVEKKHGKYDKKSAADQGRDKDGTEHLTRMSFEDRMAYYKTKYGSNAVAAKPEKPRGAAADSGCDTTHDNTASASSKNAKKRRNRRNRGSSYSGAASAEGAKTSTSPAQKPKSQTAVASTPSAETPQKQGLFAKIAGLFKKRGS